jgi:hypothetical protein
MTCVDARRVAAQGVGGREEAVALAGMVLADARDRIFLRTVRDVVASSCVYGSGHVGKALPLSDDFVALFEGEGADDAVVMTDHFREHLTAPEHEADWRCLSRALFYL